MSAKNVIEATEQTFVEEVVDRSRTIPVVVDFWAEWCGPCRTLGPILERLAVEANGSWILAKVDVDSNPGLAATFGIQGIPAVRAWKDGREIAEFVGALPEPQVREWLARLGPSPAEQEFDRALVALDAGDEDTAAQSLRRVLELDPAHADAKARLERLELVSRASDLDESAARRRLEADPSDADAAVQLADVFASRDELEAAFDTLVKAVRDSTGEERERARAHLLKLLDTLPADDRRAMKARRDLSLALF